MSSAFLLNHLSHCSGLKLAHAFLLALLVPYLGTAEASPEGRSCPRDSTADDGTSLLTARLLRSPHVDVGEFAAQQTVGSEDHQARMYVNNQMSFPIYNVLLEHKFTKEGKTETLSQSKMNPGDQQGGTLVHYQTGWGALTDWDWWRVSYDFNCQDVSKDRVDQTVHMTSEGFPTSSGTGWKQCFLKAEDADQAVVVSLNVQTHVGVHPRNDTLYMHVHPAKSSSCQGYVTSEFPESIYLDESCPHK
eukprot:TRINITY_DN10646_c0_g1_i3.p1 TRINITY_DN10646_c0_g1~~TRINITY_DN10646_c0_g1_i3.p1  ORF type:complete len:247 (-),score=23.50 TRINITY_DN10646_c0_g1_i3:14-754(-)